MKYFEYTYLVLVAMCLVFLVVNYDSLIPDTRIYLLIFMGLFSFMFAFRRTSRLRSERKAAQEEEESEAPSPDTSDTE